MFIKKNTFQRSLLAAFLLSIAIFFDVPLKSAQSFSTQRSPYSFLSSAKKAQSSRIPGPDKHANAKTGRRVGTVLIYPTLSVQQRYNDNIYVTEQNTENDFITSIQPEVTIETEKGRHNFALDAAADISHYHEHTSENTEDFTIGFSSTLEGYHNLKFPISARYTQDTRARSNRNIASITEEPVEFEEIKFDAGVIYVPNRLSLATNLSYSQTRLENGQLRTTGVQTVNEDGDTDDINLKVTASYDTRHIIKPFIEFDYTKTDFKNRQFTGNSFNGISRSNNLYRGVTGVLFDHHDIITGRIGAGYEHRSYKDSGISDQNNTVLEADIDWKPTPRLRLGTKVQKTNREDNLIQSGTDDFSASVAARYDVGRQINITGQSGYKNRKFTESIREDDLYGSNIRLNYILTPRISINTGYTYKDAESNAAGFSYNQNLITVGLNTAL